MSNIDCDAKLLITQQEHLTPTHIHFRLKHSVYKQMRNDIMNICKKIERSLSNMFNNSNACSLISDSKCSSVTERSRHRSSISGVIQKYKELTKDIDEQIEGVCKMGKVVHVEKMINYKEQLYNELKNENDVLKKISNVHLKTLKEYEYKTEKGSHIEELKQKMQSLKNEIRAQRDIYLQTEMQIREQISQINHLHFKIRNISDNMQFMKEQCDDKEKVDDDIKGNNIEKLKQDKKERKNSLKLLEKETHIKIKEQLDLIERLENEIKILTELAHQKENEKRMISLRIKERKRNKQQHLKIKSIFNRNALFHKPKQTIQNYSFITKRNSHSIPFPYKQISHNHSYKNNNGNITSHKEQPKTKTLIQIEELIKDLEKSLIESTPPINKLPPLPISKTNCGINTSNEHNINNSNIIVNQ